MISKRAIPIPVFLLLTIWLAAAPAGVRAQCCGVPVPTTETCSFLENRVTSTTVFKATLGPQNFHDRHWQELRGNTSDIDRCHDGADGNSPYDTYHITPGPPVLINSASEFGDQVGFFTQSIDWYRNAAAQNLYHSVIPCDAEGFQNEEIECDSNTYWVFANDTALTIMIESQSVTNCRYPSLGQGDCKQIAY